jgi:hypothetical protein
MANAKKKQVKANISTKPTKHNIQDKSVYSSAILVVCIAIALSLLTSYDMLRFSNVGSILESDVSSQMTADEKYEEAMQLWNSQPVDRVPFSEMTHEKLMQQYIVHRKPVVITGAYADSPLTEGVDDESWGWEGMKRRFGNVKLETRVLGGTKGCTGTGLCEGKTVTIKELFDEYFLNEKRNVKRVPYPHDVQLEVVIPEMFETYQKHAFFGENLLLPLKVGTDRWPSLFFGARDTQTNLHIDSMGTSFTMAVFRGRKQFMLIDPKYGSKLCMERPNKGLHYGVGEDPFKPDFERCPSAKDIPALFADLKAGDIFYAPGSYHHAARNLEDSVGISQNFLTVHDYASIMESLGGYVPKLERQTKQNSGQQPTSITMDFLALRDMFRLLSETDYRSDWSQGKQWWNANEMTVEAHERVMQHMEKVIEAASPHERLKVATRLAYFINIRTIVAALKAIGAWECLKRKGGIDIIQELPPEGQAVAQNMMQRLEKAFALDLGGACQSIFRIFMNEVESVSIPNAVQSLGKEKGLSPQCC